jgi:hypothetical protein
MEWCRIIDDYAHNPFKIAAALKAARQAYSGPIVAWCSRIATRGCATRSSSSATCLNDADAAIIAPVYAAGEQPIEGIDRDTYAEALRAHGHRSVFVIDGADDLPALDCRSRKTGRRHRVSRRRFDHAMGGRSRSRIERAGGARVMSTRFRDACLRCAALTWKTRPLKDLVWFRAGGSGGDPVPSRRCGRPQRVPRRQAGGLPVTVIGVGSNLLVRDGGIPGVVIRLPASFGRVSADGLQIRAGAAALDSAVARAAADAGIAGLEFLRGVPGTSVARFA